MGDDRPTRRTYAESDAKRALSHRFTSAKEPRIPVEIDAEETPPPSQPPVVSQIDDTETRFAKIDDYFAEMHFKMERVWDSRHNNEKISALQQDVGKLLTSYNDFMMPAVKTMMGRLNAVETSLQEKAKIENTFYSFEWPQFKKTIEQIGSNVDRVQKDVDRVERGFENFLKQYDGHRTNNEERFKDLKSKDDQQEGRLRKLEDFTLEWKVKVAMISVMFSGLVAALAYIAEHYTK